MSKTKQAEPERVDPERAMTFEEVADLFSVSVRQVRRWVEEGWIGYIELPRGRRILARHCQEFTQSRERRVTADA